MTAKYFAILTNYGAAQLANAVALGTQMNITAMGAGDGGGTLPVPDPAQTTLIRENRRAAVNQVSVDDKNPNIIIAEQVIPENEGGWWIREIGLYDDNGGLIAIGNVPETYKPNLQEGSGRTQVLQMALIVSSTQAVTLKVDPSVVLATREYVTKSIDAAIQASEAKSAKIYATKTELSSGLSGKQPTGDYATRTELNNGLSGKQPTGDYATKTEVNSKLDKNAVVQTTGTSTTSVISQDGATKAFAGGQRFHTSPESVEMITPNGSIIIELTNNGYVNIINKNTGVLAEIPPGGLEQSAGSHPKRMMSQKGITDLAKSVETPIGMFATFPHRATQLPTKWYSTNGDRFSVSSPQGLALKSLPAELKSDWGITESGGMINVPNIKQSDGRTPFLRPVNGTERQVGSVDGDKMRRMQGEYTNSSWRDHGGGSGGASGVFSVRYSAGTSGSAGSNQGTTLIFDSEKVVPTGSEFKPLDIGVTLAIYLGV
ncbi:phage tail protein [Morganella morganii]|uniref:Phage tail protein n=1 Tax=Morganella morganii TaxID=582 RepID=A0A9Q4CR45_MORMO|nr:phage tail protein [Morganella morganii]MCY0791930.1 phage tail protein [Morganella morganii]